MYGNNDLPLDLCFLNAASDFNIDEELKRLQKIDPERYSDTEIRIQPVYIDPD